MATKVSVPVIATSKGTEMNMTKVILISAAMSTISLASFHAEAEDAALKCAKFDQNFETQVQRELEATFKGAHPELLKGELCSNQTSVEDTMRAQQVGGVIGSIASPVPIVGPLLGLLFAIASQSNDAAPKFTAKVVVAIENRIVRAVGDIPMATAEAVAQLALSASTVN